MKQTKQTKLAYPGVIIILALLTLICILVVPIFNRGGSPVFGDLFPSEQAMSFSEVWDLTFQDWAGFRSFAVQFTIIPLVLSIIMIICSFIKNKLLCVISSFCGFAVTVGLLVNLVVKHGSIVFGNFFHNTVLCLGFWLVLLLFFSTFIVSLIPRKQ